MKPLTFAASVLFGAVAAGLWPAPEAPPPAPSTTALSAIYYRAIAADWDAVLVSARELWLAGGRFIERPDHDTRELARAAWRNAQGAYAQASVFRELVISDDEHRYLSGWPLDEGLLDYVNAHYRPESGNGLARANLVRNEAVLGPGVIQRMKPVLPAYLRQLVRRDSRLPVVATGLHAVEFLLWGQPGTRGTPAQRPLTDFAITDSACTTDTRAGPGERLRECLRRRQALLALVETFAADVEQVVGRQATRGWDGIGAGHAGPPLQRLLLSLAARLHELADQVLAAERLEHQPNEFSAELQRYLSERIAAVHRAWNLSESRASLRRWALGRDPSSAELITTTLMRARDLARDLPGDRRALLGGDGPAAPLRRDLTRAARALEALADHTGDVAPDGLLVQRQ